jgi:CRP-like cAMP-binding protein
LLCRLNVTISYFYHMKYIEHLISFAPLTKSEIGIVMDKTETLSLEKDEALLKEGEICQYVSYVASGLLMYYRISETGEEKAHDFASEDDWASQYQSMIAQTPSPLGIRAIEKTTVYRISAANLKKLYTEVPVFERIARQIVEKIFIANIRRTDEFQNLKADERYESLLRTHPQLVQRVPQYYIASFLGIAPQSLSRIRKNIKP